MRGVANSAHLSPAPVAELDFSRSTDWSSEFHRVEINLPYVCTSHIRTIIDEYDGTFEKYAGTPFEKRLRLFIRINKSNMNERKLRKQNCRVCQISKYRPELYEIASKNIRMVIMVGCILRGTHSVESGMPYLEHNRGFTCFSHCKNSIDMIFEYLGIKNLEGFSKCSAQKMDGLMDIVKKIIPNFTVDQFLHTFHLLFVKKLKFPV